MIAISNAELLNIPPNNIEAEEAILGGILLDPQALSRVSEILKPDCFYIQSHALIYRAMLELDIPDLLCVTNRLIDLQLLEKIGGRAKLAQLIDRTISAINIDAIAQLVADKYRRRQLISAGREIVRIGSDTAQTWEDSLNLAENELFKLRSPENRSEAIAIASSLRTTLAEMANQVVPAYPSGLAALDKLIGGLSKQDLIVIAGRPSMGKTWLGLYLASEIAKNLPVLFFSAEMSRSQITKRFLAMHSQIDARALMHDARLDVAAASLEKLPIIIDDSPASSLTTANIRATIRATIRCTGQLGLVVLDYLQLLGSGDSNRVRELDRISQDLKSIAREFDVPFIALSQLSRAVESRSDKRPMLSDLRDSGAIEQAADLVLMLYRDEYYNKHSPDKGMLEAIVSKNRNGPVGIAKFKFDPAIGNFQNLL